MLALASLLAADTVAGSHIWHFWIAALLAIVTVLAVVATLASYFFKVTRSRYPRK
ncbi:MAG: hypothetical protein U0Q22_15440 [Acidimicrobiales bacterium]